jgi:hypothetical protein
MCLVGLSFEWFNDWFTIVRNPEGDPWGFGKILLKGCLGLPENLGGPLFSCFIAFLWPNFTQP